MKTQRDYPSFTVSAKGTRWVEQGHPWIYDAEVLSFDGEAVQRQFEQMKAQVREFLCEE